MDLIVDLEEDQARRAIDALVGLGLRPRVPVDPRDFATRSVREEWIRDRGMQVFSMYDPHNPLRVIDLFVNHPLPFEDLWSRAETYDIAGTVVRVASIPDLIQLKRLAGRPQDRSDIEQLEAIAESKRKRTDG